jgi:hypothetical protein
MTAHVEIKIDPSAQKLADYVSKHGTRDPLWIESREMGRIARGEPRRYPLTDASVLQCESCGKLESGLSARLRVVRRNGDPKWAHCPCGGNSFPIA